jgi:hypothetical protein
MSQTYTSVSDNAQEVRNPPRNHSYKLRKVKRKASPERTA